MAATIIISMAMTMTRELLRLLAWLSPAFPTGGYAYSHGLEWAVESGDVYDAATLSAWIEDVLLHGTGRNDLILLRHAHRHLGNATALAHIAELAAAATPSRERQVETRDQGGAFVAAARAWQALPLPTDTPYPVAVGALGAAQGIDEDMLAAGFAQAFAANLISVAVRLVPLGQSVGLAVLAGLEPAILRTGEITRHATLDDIGGCAFRSDIAAMRHETQQTRLFRT